MNDDAPRGSIIRFRFVRERGNLITPSNAHLSPRIEMPDGDSAFPWKRNLHCVVSGLHNRPWTFMDTQGTLDLSEVRNKTVHLLKRTVLLRATRMHETYRCSNNMALIPLLP